METEPFIDIVSSFFLTKKKNYISHKKNYFVALATS